MARSPKTFTSHSPPRARTLSGPAARRRSTRELLQSRNRAFGPNGVPTTSRQTSGTRTDTTSRLPISLGSTNKRYEPSLERRPSFVMITGSQTSSTSNIKTAGQERLVIVGATGMVGGYALRYALEHPAVGTVTAIGRKKLGISHAKLREVLHRDFADCSGLADALSGQDAAVFCLGT